MLLEGQQVAVNTNVLLFIYTQSHYENVEGMASGEKDLFSSRLPMGLGTSHRLGAHRC